MGRLRKVKHSEHTDNTEHQKIVDAHNRFRFGAQGIDFNNSLSQLDSSHVAKAMATDFFDGSNDKLRAGWAITREDFEDRIGKELQPASTEFETAKANYQHAVNQLDALYKDPNRSYSNEAIATQLNSRKEDMLAALKKQQELEVKKVEALFTETTFTKGLSNDAAESLKTETLRDLNAQHEQQRDDFNKSVDENIKQLNSIRNNFDNRVAVAANKLYGSVPMIEAIERAAEEKNARALTLANQRSGDRFFIGIDGVDLDNLKDQQGNPILQTFSGMPIEKRPTASGGFSYHIDVSRWTEFHSNLAFWKKDRYKNELLGGLTNAYMALKAAKAAKGDDTITIFAECVCSDKNIAEKKGKWLLAIQYEAAVRAGFDPKKIKIRLNGKDDIKVEELPLTQTERTRIMEQAQQKADFKKSVVGPDQAPAADSDKIQAELKTHTNTAAANAAATAATPAR